MGIIDEVAIFNVALTEKNIQTVMESGLQKIISGQLAVGPSGKLTTFWGKIRSY